MKVLVVGGGGREHAVVDALSRSPQVSKIYCAPGNAGIARQAECVPVKDTDVEGLLSLAREKEIDLTVVGPEAALVAGIVDRFREEGLRIFGPTKAAARIESSKEFAKDLMGRYGIPTAGYRAFDDYRKASEYVRSRPLPAVLKYDGLAAGKGVVIARTMEEADAALRDMLLDDKFGKGRVVVEDFLTGPEFSFMCFVSGRKVQTAKRAYWLPSRTLGRAPTASLRTCSLPVMTKRFRRISPVRCSRGMPSASSACPRPISPCSTQSAKRDA